MEEVAITNLKKLFISCGFVDEFEERLPNGINEITSIDELFQILELKFNLMSFNFNEFHTAHPYDLLSYIFEDFESYVEGVPCLSIFEHLSECIKTKYCLDNISQVDENNESKKCILSMKTDACYHYDLGDFLSLVVVDIDNMPDDFFEEWIKFSYKEHKFALSIIGGR